jgi:predicted molibdopterin-dependent oxidoreductase YjgC
MPDPITVRIDGQPVAVPAGSTVAVAVMLAGIACRRSVTGERRFPLCGMGICLECRVAINGNQHCRSCQILARPGMEVITDEL